MQKKIDIYKQHAPQFTGRAKKVSVIIPNYNYADFIIERIDSVIRQTYPIYELIVLDDCSSDDSPRIIEEKLKTIKGIKTKFIRNKKNSGCVFCQWEKGINLATGDYIWIAEADDSSHPQFLETAMRGFDDTKHNVVLSFTDSARIDEHNNMVEPHTRPTIHQEKSYIIDGKSEIQRCFAVSNTIFNVSGVVWKKGDYSALFKEARKFVVAGDWYLYYRLMELGDIAYSSRVLNYFRKHSGSVSSTVKDDIEYQEIRRIQDEIAAKYDLPNKILLEQRARLNVMDQNVSKDVHKKRIAWIIPAFNSASGGHRTIFQNVNALAKHGYECDLYIMGMSPKSAPRSRIAKFYEFPIAEVYAGFTPQHDNYDLCFCTGWQTIDAVKLFNCQKAYFIQDFEPWFFPMGGHYLMVEESYRRGYTPVTIGRWLSHKMNSGYNTAAYYFDFCADLNVYHPLDKVKKENAICCIYQPEKERRCHEIMSKALKIVQQLRPDTKIYLFGTAATCPDGLRAEMLGIISPSEINELYNKCQVGLCMSASNPSRIPFEMMATGLPVVDLYKENNLYDLPDESTLLAEPTPAAIATAIIQLLDDDKKRAQMSQAGIAFMQDKPIEYGYDQFLQAVQSILSATPADRHTKIAPLYENSPVTATTAALEVEDELTKKDLAWLHNISSRPNDLISRAKRLGFRILRKCYHLMRRII